MPSTSPARPRTIEPRAREERGFTLPDSWLRGVLAGAEGVLGTWLLVVIPSIAVYIATAAAPELGSASWLEAGQIGTGVWLAAHGAHLEIGEATFTLLPLGVTLLALALTAAAIRRAALEAWSGPLFALLAYLGGTLLLAKLAGAPGAYRAAGGAALVAAGAAAWGMRKSYPPIPVRFRDWGRSTAARFTGWVDARPRAAALRVAGTRARTAMSIGAATALRTVLTLLALAAAGLVVSIIVAFPLIRAVHDRLETDLVSTVVLIGAQLLILPTLIIWGVAYLSGGGFTLGDGTLYSPGEILSGPLPAVPVLGALPNPEGAVMQAPAWGYSFLLVGALAGVYLHRRLTRSRPDDPHLASAIGGVVAATAIVVAALFLLTTLASGGFGPGRFAADVGPRTGAVLAAAAWQLGAPMLAVAVVANPSVHHWVDRVRAKVTGSGGRGREVA